MYAESGIISATYYGDGSNLLGLPTSQWVDVDPSSAYTSIYSSGNVGIATTNPAFTLQIGGNPSNTNGLGISSEGNLRTSGIITAKSFVGSGAGVTSINADNISTGTLSASLFSNINSSGIATIGTLGVTGTSTTRNLQVTGVTTVGFITATNLYVSGIATIGTAKGDYLNVGIGTITSFASSYSQIGISTATTFKSTDIQATGVTTSPKIFSGNVQISNFNCCIRSCS